MNNKISLLPFLLLMNNWSFMDSEYQTLIKAKILTDEEVSCFKSLRCCIYHADKCLNANNCWHFNIYEQDKFSAQLS